MARPPKYSPARVKTILAAVRLGQPYMRAAAQAGIHYDTFREWRTHYPAFSAQLEQATAEGERHVLELLNGTMEDGSVPAMLGWLERRFPDDWSRGERRSLEGTGEGGAIVLQYPVLPKPAAKEEESEHGA